GDRRSHELLDRLTGLLRLGGELIEVGPDLSDRAGRRQPVAAAAALGLEDRRTAAGSGRGLSLPGEPGLERGRLQHDRLRAHERMSETAELRADHRVGAYLVRGDDELLVVARRVRQRVLLLAELGHPE